MASYTCYEGGLARCSGQPLEGCKSVSDRVSSAFWEQPCVSTVEKAEERARPGRNPKGKAAAALQAQGDGGSLHDSGCGSDDSVR